MTLGLYAIRTVSTPPVFARDAPVAKPHPRISMAADAAQCNARFRSAWGQTSNQTNTGGEGPPCQHSNNTRSAALRARNAMLAPVIREALLRIGPLTINGVAIMVGIPKEHARKALEHMRRSGMVRAPLRGSKSGWTAT